jgi:hypothetical protein
MNPVSTHILQAILHEGKVWLSYRIGIADGITLLSRRGLEAEFSALAEDEAPPVIDARPKLDPHRPETRHYRAILRYSSNEIRQLSNDIVLTLP